jgi:hypothetical protein
VLFLFFDTFWPADGNFAGGKGLKTHLRMKVGVDIKQIDSCFLKELYRKPWYYMVYYCVMPEYTPAKQGESCSTLGKQKSLRYIF